METSWQTNADHLICRWSEAGERNHYRAPWMQDPSGNVPVTHVSASVLDFATLSPFGGPEWYGCPSRREHPSRF